VSEIGTKSETNTEGFRAELQRFLAAHPPPSEGGDLRAWQRDLHAGGWVGIHWPEEHGGRAASPEEIAVYNEELARAGVPDLPGRVGLTLVGPTLVAHGTDEQRDRWMPRILTADDVWCQLFSEPGAGSDLTGLTTRAVREGAVYVVTGQKVWSSHAGSADWGIALVRTDPSEARSRGISMLAIPMDAAGVAARPIRQLTGEAEFFEVFLDEVEVPVDGLIGEEHGGWKVATTTLSNERGGAFIWKEQVRHRAAVERLWDECRRTGLLGDPLVRQHLARCRTDAVLFGLHTAGGTDPSLVKLFWAEASQHLYEVATDVLGAASLLADGDWARGLLVARANSIQGGTSEIQRDVVGERLLGLPR
jgi:alkylation response protein AidB-like acyl-CoA dehydrogenase